MENVPFYTPDFARDTVGDDKDTIDHETLITLLRDKELAALIEAGQVSLAMIKPNVGPEANRLGLNDTRAAEEIEERITNLGVVAKFSFMFDEQGVDEFYDGPAKTDSMMPAAPLKSDEFANRWEEYRALMLSGPVTVLLVYGEDAIHEWRSHLGHWNIEVNHDPDTIRGALGIDNHNNLVHGSDSAESVLREIDIIARQLERS
jgi:nucleoside diphosphate kinase